MDDLIAYVRSLLIADAALQAMWTTAGRSSVLVTVPNGQDEVQYPRIVLDARLTGGVSTGEGLASFENGVLQIFTFVKSSASTTSPYTFGWAVDRRLHQLIFGNRSAATTTLLGRTVPSSSGGAPRYRIAGLTDSAPGGAGQDSVPQVRKFMRTVGVRLSILGA